MLDAATEVIYGAREPMCGYAEWFHRQGREAEAIGVLSRWYDGVRGAGLPTKARSDASYDLACGLARAGRLDDAMTYLPDAFAYHDRGAVGVLKAWALGRPRPTRWAGEGEDHRGTRGSRGARSAEPPVPR